MEDGRVLETGTHSELVARGGNYARMVKTQLLGDQSRSPRLSEAEIADARNPGGLLGEAALVVYGAAGQRCGARRRRAAQAARAARQGRRRAPRRAVRRRRPRAPARTAGLGACGKRRRDGRGRAADRPAGRARIGRAPDHRHGDRRGGRAAAASGGPRSTSSCRSTRRPRSAAFSIIGGPGSRSSPSRSCGRPCCARFAGARCRLPWSMRACRSARSARGGPSRRWRAPCSAVPSCSWRRRLADAERLRALGARRVVVCGNLKFDAPPPPADAGALAALRREIGDRPVLVAASTHRGRGGGGRRRACRPRPRRRAPPDHPRAASSGARRGGRRGDRREPG